MTDLVTKLISALPREETAALFELRDRLADALRKNIDDESARIALRAFLIWHNRRGQGLDWSLPELPANGGAIQNLHRLIQSISSYQRQYQDALADERVNEIIDIELSIEGGDTFGFAVLTKDDKKFIRERLVLIKDLISSSILSERKKAALFKRIADLEIEIETAGTRTDRFFAFLGDAAFVVGEMAEKARPFSDQVREMMKIVYLRREDTERVRLPRGDNDLLLPPPSN